LPVNGGIRSIARDYTVKPNLAAVTLVVSFLSGCTDANKTYPSTEWIRIASEDGRFSASFPTKPECTRPVDDDETMYVADAGGGAVEFVIRCKRNADPSVSLDDRLARTVETMKSTNVTTRSIEMCGYAAREMTHEYIYDGVRWVSRQRVFCAGNTMYQVIVLGLQAQSYPEREARRFFSEFRLEAR